MLSQKTTGFHGSSTGNVRYLTVKEVATTLRIGITTARRIFQDVEGVVRITAKPTIEESKRKRAQRISLRIPLEVFERVQAEMTIRTEGASSVVSGHIGTPDSGAGAPNEEITT